MSASDSAARGRRLHELHRGGILLLPNAWDIATAKILAQAGFPALATTSSGIAFAQGFRDGERMGRERMLDVVARVAAAVDVPVTADLEAGYGPRPQDVAETMRLAVAAGAVGANLEDSPTDGSVPLYGLEQACERVRAAREGADGTGVPFVLNARTDPYLRRPQADAADNFAEAVRRGQAFAEAGADCIFVPGRLDADTMRRLAAELPVPLNVLGALSGWTAPPLAEMEALGVRRVSIGGSLSLAVLGMVRRVAGELRAHGRFDYGAEALTNAELNRMMEG